MSMCHSEITECIHANQQKSYIFGWFIAQDVYLELALTLLHYQIASGLCIEACLCNTWSDFLYSCNERCHDCSARRQEIVKLTEQLTVAMMRADFETFS